MYCIVGLQTSLMLILVRICCIFLSFHIWNNEFLYPALKNRGVYWFTSVCSSVHPSTLLFVRLLIFLYIYDILSYILSCTAGV